MYNHFVNHQGPKAVNCLCSAGGSAVVVNIIAVPSTGYQPELETV